jgi:hypothetical protein
MDEHRLGLKPITRRIWAPIGERPVALGHHRFEWLYVTGFLEPETGRTVWNVSTAISKEMFELILADFAETVGADAQSASCFSSTTPAGTVPRTVPDGVGLVFQPAHRPELQPAEHLWEYVDEPLVNAYFESLNALDHTVGQRCAALTEQCDMIRNSALFHWWPRRSQKK